MPLACSAMAPLKPSRTGRRPDAHFSTYLHYLHSVRSPSHVERWPSFSGGQCMLEWPPTLTTGAVESIW